MTARIHLNSKRSFLVGASWQHDPAWAVRQIHIYLGPWLLTFTKQAAS